MAVWQGKTQGPAGWDLQPGSRQGTKSHLLQPPTQLRKCIGICLSCTDCVLKDARKTYSNLPINHLHLWWRTTRSTEQQVPAAVFSRSVPFLESHDEEPFLCQMHVMWEWPPALSSQISTYQITALELMFFQSRLLIYPAHISMKLGGMLSSAPSVWEHPGTPAFPAACPKIVSGDQTKPPLQTPGFLPHHRDLQQPSAGALPHLTMQCNKFSLKAPLCACISTWIY